MTLIPEFGLSEWSGFWLILLLILVRYGLMAILDREAIARASHFPPLVGREKGMLKVYAVTNLVLILYPVFLSIKVGTAWVVVGLPVLAAGLALCALSVIDFARPNPDGRLDGGLYRFSRNPMYVAYFVFYVGVGLMTASWLYLVILAIFQISSHWIILSEERWCLERFGDAYRAYMGRVRRYVGRK